MGKLGHTAYVALGANLGEPLKALNEVIEVINQENGVCVEACSHFYQTAPIDSSGPDYMNAVICVSTSLSAEALLKALLRIEKDFGRVRPAGVHNAPRTMDLDLLTYDQEKCQSELLTLPHPRMHQRAFVLVPMCDIDPNAPIAGKGVAKDFLDDVKDQPIYQIV